MGPIPDNDLSRRNKGRTVKSGGRALLEGKVTIGGRERNTYPVLVK